MSNLTPTSHAKWMEQALRLAEKAYDKNEVPVGALVVHEGVIIGKGYNQCESLKDPTAHAEIIAISAATNTLEDWRLDECILYITKEPCPMCAGAIINARMKMIVFGCYDEEKGCCGSLYQLCGDPRLGPKIAVKGGVLEEKCQSLIQSFFKSCRKP